MDKRTYFNKMDKRQYFNKDLKINAETGLRGYPKDSIIKIKVNENGVPIDSYWRRRLIDSKIDHCVSFVDAEKKSDKPDNKKDIKADNKKDIKSKGN